VDFVLFCFSFIFLFFVFEAGFLNNFGWFWMFLVVICDFLLVLVNFNVLCWVFGWFCLLLLGLLFFWGGA
jgi:hypothetical protein